MVDPQVTVAVPVKDRRDRMLACLQSILEQDHPSFEVLVLDNDSGDGTAEACRALAATAAVPVRVEVVPGTLGRVRNRARELARGEFLAYTDSDCTPQPGWLRNATAALAADGGLGFVCGPTVPPEPPRRNWARLIDVREFSWRFESCNVVFRTEPFRASAGFDEVVGDGWEDTAAGYEMLSRGWRAGFVPRAVVHHDVTYPGLLWHLRREQRQSNAAYVVRRYPEIRRRLLFARYFFSVRSAAFVVLVAAVPLARRHRAARVLMLPYGLAMARRVSPRLMAETAVFDAAVLVALVRGAVRHRSLVI